MNVGRTICLLPLLLLAACGNNPPCGEAGVTKTVRNLATHYVVNDHLPARLPEEVDLSSSIELSSITVAKWDPTIRSAVCNTRYRLDRPALGREFKLRAQTLDNPDLKPFSRTNELEGRVTANRARIENGTIVYSVQRTTEGNWWINLMAMQSD